jgi:TetR/AcrR family transcriptional repressor of nem operon
MRRSREDTAQTRKKIVETASRLFRSRGVARVSVADIMGALGLTVGGFYRHFASKDALVAEVIEAASIASTSRQAQTAPGAAAKRRAAALVETYLSPLHRDHPEAGCPVASLCAEIPHEAPAAKEAFTKALQRLLAVVAEVVPGEGAESRAERLFIAASLVGGLVLSRATSDPKLSSELLRAVRARILGTLGT